MFKKFELKKNSWHLWVMNYIWNLDETDFQYMCPYFWLSLVNVFVLFLPIFIVKTFIIKPIKWVGYKLESYSKKRGEKRYEKSVRNAELIDKQVDIYLDILKRNPDKLQTFATKIGREEKLSVVERKIFYCKDLDIELGQDLYVKFVAWRQKAENNYYDYLKDLRYARDQKKVQNKIKINKIVKVTKPIAVSIIVLAAIASLLGAIYGLYLAGKYTVGLSSYFWGEFRWWIGCIIFVIAMLIALVSIVVVLVQLLRDIDIELSPAFADKFFKLLNFLFVTNWLVRGLVWLVKGIGFFFVVLFQMFKNNCPPIIWK